VTKQETFDIVARHLLTQNETAYEPNRGCMYRTSDGKKCAIGCLIPDDRYTPKIESTSLFLGDPAGALIRDLGYDMDTIGMLEDLRLVHDARSVFDWPKALFGVAEKHELSDAVVTEHLAQVALRSVEGPSSGQ
jgi:hypothetical protein